MIAVKKMICMTPAGVYVLGVLNDEFVAGLTGLVQAHLPQSLIAFCSDHVRFVLRSVRCLKIIISQGSVAQGC